MKMIKIYRLFIFLSNYIYVRRMILYYLLSYFYRFAILTIHNMFDTICNAYDIANFATDLLK